MPALTEEHLLSCKTLDLLFWKNAHVMSFDIERKRWHFELEAKLCECLIKYEVEGEDEFYVRHYALSILLISATSLCLNIHKDKTGFYKDSKLSQDVIDTLNLHELNISIDIVKALMSDASVDQDIVMKIYNELFFDKSLNFIKIPSAYLVDFLTSCYLFEDPYAVISLLADLSEERFLKSDNLPTKGDYVTPLVRLVLITQMTELAIMRWHKALLDTVHYQDSSSIKVKGKIRPIDISVSFHEFNTEISCEVLTSVLLKKTPSVQKFNDFTYIRDRKHGTELKLEWMKYVVHRHKLQVFKYKEDGEKPFRIKKILSYILSSFITYLKLIEDDQDFSSTIYSSADPKIDKAEVTAIHTKSVKKMRKKPSITTYWQLTLLEEFGTSITTKTLWEVESELSREVYGRVGKQFEEYENISGQLCFQWYQTLVQLSAIKPRLGSKCITSN
jgi:hypothetical protein